jgi:ribosomal protein L14E/L6E/L27E
VDLPLFRYSDGETAGVEKGEKIRFIVVDDIKGETVTIFVESSPQGFEEFMPKAQKVIETVEWKGA